MALIQHWPLQDNAASTTVVAAGATSTGNEVDLLADNTSRGTISLYLVYTPGAVPSGPITVTYLDGRVTGQAYPVQSFTVSASDRPASAAQKEYLGRLPCGRFGSASVRNASGVALTNVSVLYALEKEG